MKLLIVDDSLIIRNKINIALADTFKKIIRAEDGVKAVAAARKEKPDVITMDLTMPHMDGVSCIKNILAFQPNTHILVVSALADKKTAISALSHGANGFLCKPFTAEELADAIKKVLKINFDMDKQ